jgi:hypothetical protein
MEPVGGGGRRWGGRSGGCEGLIHQQLPGGFAGTTFAGDELEELQERRRRESLLRDLRGWQPGSRADERYQKRIEDWKELASDFLCDLYSLRQDADAISRRYFDGRELLFPAHTRSLAKLVEVVEELVVVINEGFADEVGQETGTSAGIEASRPPNFINIAVLKEALTPAARQHTAFLVDIAKAEALDDMGENQAAVEIMERQL